jgi:multisubunit Na+/H+ antiporter MnhB subunit
MDINRFMGDLKPWVSLMFGTAFLCTTIAYGDIKSERPPRQKKVIRLMMLIITVVCFILAAVSFINMH